MPARVLSITYISIYLVRHFRLWMLVPIGPNGVYVVSRGCLFFSAGVPPYASLLDRSLVCCAKFI